MIICRLNLSRRFLHHLFFLSLVLLGCNKNSEEKSASASPGARIVEAWLPSLTDVTAEAGLAKFKHDNGAAGNMWFPEQMGAGCGFIDYDNDNWADIILVGGGRWEGDERGPAQGLWLFKNQRNGSFVDVTAEVGLADVVAWGTGILSGDFDNDGDDDLYLTALGYNHLFKNDGGKFSDITARAGVAGKNIWSSSAVFFDADRDGWLDLYVGNYADWTPETDIYCSIGDGKKVYCRPAVYKGIASTYFYNNGDGTFSDKTAEAGFLPASGKSLGIAMFDYNNDGWPDLAVANDGEHDLLYENQHDGTFRDVGPERGMAFGENGEARAGMGIDAGVIDSTGMESVFVGNFSNEMIGVYRYLDNGFFINRDAVSRIGRASLMSLTFGLFLFDVELDGDLDLFVANGHVYPIRTQFQQGITYRQRSQLFINNGDGNFKEINDEVGGVLLEKMVARGAVYGDYDRDGDLDVLLTENNGPAHLWRNDLPPANFLRIKLVGTKSNKNGLGTKVVATVGKQKMFRRCRTGSSYLSQLERTLTFGLGTAGKVDTLRVYWLSGEVQEFYDVFGNREILITEGAQEFSVLQ